MVAPADPIQYMAGTNVCRIFGDLPRRLRIGNTIRKENLLRRLGNFYRQPLIGRRSPNIAKQQLRIVGIAVIVSVIRNGGLCPIGRATQQSFGRLFGPAAPILPEPG